MMKSLHRRLLPFVVLGAFVAPVAQAASAEFAALVQDWYQDGFKAHPLFAGAAGFHDWDDRLDDVSLAGHDAEQKRLHYWLARFEAFDRTGLTVGERDDLEVASAQVKAALLEEEKIQSWRHDPGRYSNLATEAVFATIKRDYAPLAARMRFAIAREQAIPAMLATAKTVIQDPPRIHVEVALENIDGALAFFKSSAPEAFKAVADAKLQKDFAAANAAAIAALKDYRAWLRSTLVHAHGEFALGAENYHLKLSYEEMVDLPIDQVLAIGEAQLEKDQAAYAATARLIDPDKTPDAVVADLQKDHPKADALVSTARAELIQLRKFIDRRGLTPLPPEEMPTVAATPGFERALIEAEMDPPGPYDKTAKEAFYFVTPPDDGVSAKERESYLRGFNIPVLNNTSVHEVFPGHFVQLMLMRSLPDLSMIRRLTGANSNVEGWAHYCEQMTLDEGYGGADPRLRMGQILDALLRDARYIAGIKLHTQGWTIAQATDFFVKEGHQTRPMAEKEAKRGASDPTYLYYTLGKLEILKLRADWQAKQGDQYEIGAFHKRLLEGGTVPIKMIRREMMGEDGPLL